MMRASRHHSCSQGCGAVFTRRDNAQRHARRCGGGDAHGDPQQDSCACGRTFTVSTAYGLKRHLQSGSCREAPTTMQPKLPLVCPDCRHQWPATRARDYQAHLEAQACRWHLLCPLCQHTVELRGTLEQEHDVCASCDHLAIQLHQETRRDPVLNYPFGTPVHGLVSPKVWRTTAHPEEKKKEPPAMMATPFGFRKRRRVWPMSPPATQWLPTPAGDAVVQSAREPTPEDLRLMRWYSVGFDPERAQQAPPHHRLQEPVAPLGLHEDQNDQKDAALLETEREALREYATGAFAFCAHSDVWKALEAHVHKCPGKKVSAHLWRASGREMGPAGNMVQQDTDRYYWWFLSPQAACTHASLDLLPPVPMGPLPTPERLQQWCTTMRMRRPEPLTRDKFMHLTREDQQALYRALRSLTALDRAHHTEAWHRLSPFLQLLQRYGQEVDHGMKLVSPDGFERQQEEAQNRQWQQRRQLRVLRVQHPRLPGGKRLHKKAAYRVVLPFPSVRTRDLTRPWLVHPLMSLSGPVRVLQRQALMRQPGSATVAHNEQQQRALAAAEWMCASMDPVKPKAEGQRVPLRDMIEAQLMARQ